MKHYELREISSQLQIKTFLGCEKPGNFYIITVITIFRTMTILLFLQCRLSYLTMYGDKMFLNIFSVLEIKFLENVFGGDFSDRSEVVKSVDVEWLQTIMWYQIVSGVVLKKSTPLDCFIKVIRTRLWSYDKKIETCWTELNVSLRKRLAWRQDGDCWVDQVRRALSGSCLNYINFLAILKCKPQPSHLNHFIKGLRMEVLSI